MDIQETNPPHEINSTLTPAGSGEIKQLERSQS